MTIPNDLAERHRTELDEAPTAVAARLAGAPSPDVAEILNRLRLTDAATVIEALPRQQAAEVFDQPTLRRRGILLCQLDAERAAQVLATLSADERTDVAREMGEHERRRLLPKLAQSYRQLVANLADELPDREVPRARAELRRLFGGPISVRPAANGDFLEARVPNENRQWNWRLRTVPQ